jgi:hypothetical protein
LVHASFHQKIRIFLFEDDVLRRILRRERHFGPDLGHIGFHLFQPHFLGDGYPVVTIQDKIGIPQLIDPDRRQAGTARRGHDRLDGCPALPVGIVQREEVVVEILIAVHTPYNRVHRDFHQAFGREARGVQPLGDLIIRQ